MNDPTLFPIPVRAADDFNEPQEIYFSPATWKQGVEFYQQMTGGEAPSPAGPPTAVFKSKLGYEIRVTQTNDVNILAKQAANDIFFLPLIDANWVVQGIHIAQQSGAQVALPPINVVVYPILTRLPIRRYITMGIVRFGQGLQATPNDTTLGLIHNPNW
ncbi:hypothetical protein [Hymenobacter terrestris]|uniref:Uncharacterized protein n=1 Tax=Hymenobacter terrestris TaxID=2748310 RepID=A0ABX2Q7L8_9BACT|nr:hypothetical protein [Hymenobacter terrestris]NVO86559.1 hypothetical protein [Hymenobacter terrestris]